MQNPSLHIPFLAKANTARFLEVISLHPQLLHYKIMQQRFMSISQDQICDFFMAGDKIACICILAKEMTDIAFLKLYVILPPHLLSESIITNRLYLIKRDLLESILLSNIPDFIFTKMVNDDNPEDNLEASRAAEIAK